MHGPVTSVIQAYYSQGRTALGEADFTNECKKPGNNIARLMVARLKNKKGQVVKEFSINEDIFIEMEYEIIQTGHILTPNFHFKTSDGTYAFVSSDSVTNTEALLKRQPGKYLARCKIPGNFLNDGTYYVGLALSTMETSKVHFYESDLLQFTVVDPIEGTITRGDYVGAVPGVIRPALDWESERLK